jgi:hypothetical protein
MSTSYSHKKIPQFNPDYYRSWASDVESAFAERNWSKHLILANDTIPANVTDNKIIEEHKANVINAHAFLNQSIPYEYKTHIRSCKTAAKLYAEALATATYIRNRLPTKSLAFNMSPHEA